MSSQKENNLKFGIIGYPLSHTFSPQIHEHWLKSYGKSGTYEILEVDELGLDNLFSNNAVSYTHLTLPTNREV